MKIKDKRSCPRCNQIMGDYPALSRRDNKTDICSSCGTEEALFDFRLKDIATPKTLLAVKTEREWLRRLE